MLRCLFALYLLSQCDCSAEAQLHLYVKRQYFNTYELFDVKVLPALCELFVAFCKNLASSGNNGQDLKTSFKIY